MLKYSTHIAIYFVVSDRKVSDEKRNTVKHLNDKIIIGKMHILFWPVAYTFSWQ